MDSDNKPEEGQQYFGNQTVPVSPINQPAQPVAGVEANLPQPAPAVADVAPKKSRRKLYILASIFLVVTALTVAGFMILPGMFVPKQDYADSRAILEDIAKIDETYYKDYAAAMAFLKSEGLTVNKQMDAAVVALQNDVKSMKDSLAQFRTSTSTLNARKNLEVASKYKAYDEKVTSYLAFLDRSANSVGPYLYAMRMVGGQLGEAGDIFTQLNDAANALDVISNQLDSTSQDIGNGSVSNGGVTKEQGLAAFDAKSEKYKAPLQKLKDSNSEIGNIADSFILIIEQMRAAYAKRFDDTTQYGYTQAKATYKDTVARVAIDSKASATVANEKIIAANKDNDVTREFVDLINILIKKSGLSDFHKVVEPASNT